MPAAEPPIATDHPLSVETLEQLARLDAHGHPILSIYLDLDPTRFPTPDTRATELGSLLDYARREAGRDADRVQAWLEADGALRDGVHGLAIFSSEPAGIFDTVRLRGPVEPLAVVDAIPWLGPLAAIISPGDWGVAVVSRRAARLLRGGPDGLSEFAAIDDDVYRRHAQGGWSQARYQRGIEEQVAAHVRRVTERLLRAHLRRPFAQLVLVCSGELRPTIAHYLHSELTAVLAGTVDADLEHSSLEEIVRVVAPAIERVEHDLERNLIARLDQALGTGGPAAAGLDDVLSSLEEQRVATLLVPEHSGLKAGRCPTCERLSTDGERRCPLDGDTRAEVDAVEYAIDEAVRQAAQVVVARYEPQWLHQHGEIASLLRW